jgi:hypothetical protein
MSRRILVPLPIQRFRVDRPGALPAMKHFEQRVRFLFILLHFTSLSSATFLLFF